MSLKNERDLSIQNLFGRYNLGSLPKSPFSDEVATNLTNRVKSRLVDLEKDLQDKKVTFLFFLSGYIYSLLGAYDLREMAEFSRIISSWQMWQVK